MKSGPMESSATVTGIGGWGRGILAPSAISRFYGGVTEVGKGGVPGGLDSTGGKSSTADGGQTILVFVSGYLQLQ